MSNPNDPWSQRPGGDRPDQPTERFDQPTERYHTSDPYQAYGNYKPTEEYPTYYQQGYGQPTNPTQQYPTYGEAPPLEDQSGYGQPPQGPKSGKGVWIALAAIVVLIAAVAGLGYLLFAADDDSSNTASSNTAAATTTTTTRAPATTAPTRPTTAPPTPIPLPTDLGIPGLGDALGDLGAAWGTITSVDGATLTLSSVTGETVTVRTDANTRVVAVGGNSVADLKPGDSIVAQGEKGADGTFLATEIIVMALPNLDGFGN